MVARNVVVHTTNPFRSRFDSGHRQIGDFSWFKSSTQGFFFSFFFSFPFLYLTFTDFHVRDKIVRLFYIDAEIQGV